MERSEELLDVVKSIEEAAQLSRIRMQRNFEEMGTRFDAMDERFDRVDTRLGRLETRLEAVEDGQNLMRSDIADLKRRAR